MFLLRYLYVLALVIWMGGLVVAGAIVAPAVFEVLQNGTAPDGRSLAGAVVGEVLRRLHLLAYAMAAAMLIALGASNESSARGRSASAFARSDRRHHARRHPRLWIGAQSARRGDRSGAIDGPVASLPAGDTRRTEFYRLHGCS